MDYALAITNLVDTNYFGGVALQHNGSIARTYAELYILNDNTNQSVKPIEAVLQNAYTAQLAIETTATTNAQSRAITQDNVKGYLLAQLTTSNPNVVTIYTNIKPIIDGNMRILNAVNNTIALYNLADTSIIDVATTAGKAKYLRAVLHVIALLG